MRFTVVFIFLCLGIRAQSSDSLIHEIMQVASDTERVNLLYKTGFDLRNTDPAHAYRLARACEHEALLSNSKKHLAKSYNLLGILFYKRSDYTKALQYHRRALQLREEIQDKLGIAISETNLGNIYTDLLYFRLAENSYLDALKQYKELDNTLQTAKCLINLGVLKHEQKQNIPAIHNFKEALKLGNSIGDYEILAICNSNIGELMAEQGLLDTALLYTEEGLKMRNMLDNEVEVADSYLNMAHIFTLQKRYSEAENYLGLAEKIAHDYDYTQARLILYKLKAELYHDTKNPDKAYLYLQKHYSLKDSLQNLEKETMVLLDEETPETTYETGHAKPAGNTWLLISCIACLFLVPFILFRYKR
ncbi:MAG: tetratricopeptide repeat protein [Bacteroidetes bacterium]|nr:tetratricopeptide repeat protein [Bacteroidota bacterium]